MHACNGGGKNEENNQWKDISKEETQVKLWILNEVENLRKTERVTT